VSLRVPAIVPSNSATDSSERLGFVCDCYKAVGGSEINVRSALQEQTSHCKREEKARFNDPHLSEECEAKLIVPCRRFSL
jgi:hypothetical protein